MEKGQRQMKAAGKERENSVFERERGLEVKETTD